MKRLLAFVVLAACAAPVPQNGPPDVPGLLRNPTAPLASQADVTAERLKGDWIVRQAQGIKDQVARRLSISPGLNGTLVLSSDAVEQTIVMIPIGPGRWEVVQARAGFPNDPLWVLWMDFDDRTVAIGGPTGKFVWIMDRMPAGGADRIAAAREILEWYGYDLNQLETVQ